MLLSLLSYLFRSLLLLLSSSLSPFSFLLLLAITAAAAAAFPYTRETLFFSFSSHHPPFFLPLSIHPHRMHPLFPTTVKPILFLVSVARPSTSLLSHTHTPLALPPTHLPQPPSTRFPDVLFVSPFLFTPLFPSLTSPPYSIASAVTSFLSLSLSFSLSRSLVSFLFPRFRPNPSTPAHTPRRCVHLQRASVFRFPLSSLALPSSLPIPSRFRANSAAEWQTPHAAAEVATCGLLSAADAALFVFPAVHMRCFWFLPPLLSCCLLCCSLAVNS